MVPPPPPQSYGSRRTVLPSPLSAIDIQYIYPIYIHDVGTYPTLSLLFLALWDLKFRSLSLKPYRVTRFCYCRV